MSEDVRRIQPIGNSGDSTEVEGFARRVAGMVMPSTSVVFDVGDEAADVRRITVQVADLRAQRWTKTWRVEIYLSTSRDGPPVSAGHTFTIVTGAITETILAGGHYRANTDAMGKLEFDLEIAGVATRYVVVKVEGHSEASEAVTWA